MDYFYLRKWDRWRKGEWYIFIVSEKEREWVFDIIMMIKLKVDKIYCWCIN